MLHIADIGLFWGLRAGSAPGYPLQVPPLGGGTSAPIPNPGQRLRSHPQPQPMPLRSRVRGCSGMRGQVGVILVIALGL
jgi:hypothetical protein